jgi:hypothetical protein
MDYLFSHSLVDDPHSPIVQAYRSQFSLDEFNTLDTLHNFDPNPQSQYHFRSTDSTSPYESMPFQTHDTNPNNVSQNEPFYSFSTPLFYPLENATDHGVTNTTVFIKELLCAFNLKEVFPNIYPDTIENLGNSYLLNDLDPPKRYQSDAVIARTVIVSTKNRVDLEDPSTYPSFSQVFSSVLPNLRHSSPSSSSATYSTILSFRNPLTLLDFDVYYDSSSSFGPFDYSPSLTSYIDDYDPDNPLSNPYVFASPFSIPPFPSFTSYHLPFWNATKHSTTSSIDFSHPDVNPTIFHPGHPVVYNTTRSNIIETGALFLLFAIAPKNTLITGIPEEDNQLDLAPILLPRLEAYCRTVFANPS